MYEEENASSSFSKLPASDSRLPYYWLDFQKSYIKLMGFFLGGGFFFWVMGSFFISNNLFRFTYNQVYVTIFSSIV